MRVKQVNSVLGDFDGDSPVQALFAQLDNGGAARGKVRAQERIAACTLTTSPARDLIRLGVHYDKRTLRLCPQSPALKLVSLH